MSKVEKIHVKMTFKFTEQERQNFKDAVPIANQLLNRASGDQLDKSKIVRAAVRDFIAQIQQGFVPQWLKNSPEAQVPAKKSKAKPPENKDPGIKKKSRSRDKK